MLFLRLTGMSSMSIMRTRITYHICMRILIHWHEPVKQRIITRLKTFHMIALKPYMEYQRISAEIIMRSWFRTACNLCNRYAIVRFQMYSMRTSSSDHNGATHADKAYDVILSSLSLPNWKRIDDESIACMIDDNEMIRVNVIIEDNAVMLNVVLHVPHDYEHMDGFLQDCVMMHGCITIMGE